MEEQKDIKNLISLLTWQFAKSMPNIPHEYIVTDNYPEKVGEITKFIAEIEKKGYTKPFCGKEYQYLETNISIIFLNFFRLI